ncbi:MAG: hypothetical protein ACR2PZ_11635, partial [Pseudomonadales bacterium]
LLIGLPALFLIVIYGASELGGEVVTLDRAEPTGEMSEVRIWIVDQDDVSWVEHGEADSFWIARLAESPTVVLNREGRAVSYLGTPDRESHDLYHDLRREKYGWADQILELLSGGEADCQGIPVRLQKMSS